MAVKKKRIKLDGTEAKSNAGRPTVFTPEVLRKIEECAALDASIGEICFYAGISHDAYNMYMKSHPEFFVRIEALREKPVLAARQAVVKKMTESYTSSMDYLSRKRKKEFAARTETDVTHHVPQPILNVLFNNNSDQAGSKPE
jgi:hypothetical protein